MKEISKKKTMSNVLFSTSAYNAESTIRRTIESILGQTYSDFLYFCCDNGSTDATGDIIREYAKRDRRVVMLQNLRNNKPDPESYFQHRLISAKYGFHRNSFYAHLDGDDEYHPDFLKTTLHFAKENKLDMVLSGTEYISPDGSSRMDTPEETLVLEGKQLVSYLPNYYKYTTRFWSVLFSMKLTAEFNPPTEVFDKGSNFRDGEATLRALSFAKRIGVLSKSLHKNYVGQGSYSYTYTPNWFWGIVEMQHALRMFILSHGPMSKKSENFLNLRFFLWLNLLLPRLRMATIALSTRVNDMILIFSNNRTQKLFALNWKSIGINTDKKEFLRENLEWAFSTIDDPTAHPYNEELIRILVRLLRKKRTGMLISKNANSLRNELQSKRRGR